MLVRRNRQTNNVAKAVRLASRTSYGMEISQDNGLILINMNLKSIKTEMKALKVTYSRLISKGNYENAKIEIELEVEQGEKAADVYEAAKNWVEKRIAVEKLSDYTIEKAKKVMDDKRNHTLAQIEEAEEILSKLKVQDDELPF